MNPYFYYLQPDGFIDHIMNESLQDVDESGIFAGIISYKNVLGSSHSLEINMDSRLDLIEYYLSNKDADKTLVSASIDYYFPIDERYINVYQQNVMCCSTVELYLLNAFYCEARRKIYGNLLWGRDMVWNNQRYHLKLEPGYKYDVVYITRDHMLGYNK